MKNNVKLIMSIILEVRALTPTITCLLYYMHIILATK